MARRRLVRRDGRALRRVARDPVHGARVRRRVVLVRGEVLRHPRRADRPAAPLEVPRLHRRHLDKTYILAAQKGWGVVVPPLLPYEALREQLDLYRAKCKEFGTEPDIVWIHACYLDEDRDTALREAEAGIKGFLAGNASPLVEYEKPPADELTAAGYGFYTAGILEKLAETPYDEMIAGDIVWVGTPDDVIERIEAVRDVCEGLTEISITVNPGGFDHWQAIKNQELFAHKVMPHFKRSQ